MQVGEHSADGILSGHGSSSGSGGGIFLGGPRSSGGGTMFRPNGSAAIPRPSYMFNSNVANNVINPNSSSCNSASIKNVSKSNFAAVSTDSASSSTPIPAITSSSSSSNPGIFFIYVTYTKYTSWMNWTDVSICIVQHSTFLFHIYTPTRTFCCSHHEGHSNMQPSASKSSLPAGPVAPPITAPVAPNSHTVVVDLSGGDSLPGNVAAIETATASATATKTLISIITTAATATTIVVVVVTPLATITRTPPAHTLLGQYTCRTGCLLRRALRQCTTRSYSKRVIHCNTYSSNNNIF